ncbi:hypothetical protein BJ970_002763 [Saccharopolyspora phatthalungensis]|uniref:Uncharacterized protein n=1 Tax=Saccharopolyspora phatthalungensis TaxID=664693 RepID=A0A840Q9H1_9PSEU|nr:hypothetical protein [Saccharopolyspora phatthalungensis]
MSRHFETDRGKIYPASVIDRSIRWLRPRYR